MGVSISPSEESLAPGAASRIEGMAQLVDQLIASDAVAAVPAEEIRKLVTSAVKLYAAACERAGTELIPVTSEISTTEAVRLAVALSRSQNLSAFDLALWFAQTDPAGSR